MALSALTAFTWLIHLIVFSMYVDGQGNRQIVQQFRFADYTSGGAKIIGQFTIGLLFYLGHAKLTARVLNIVLQQDMMISTESNLKNK